MSIYQVKATSVVCYCPRCLTTTEKAWAALTLGNDDGVNTFTVVCDTCSLSLTYTLPNQRISMAQLALAEVFNLCKGAASYTGAWAEADVDTLLGSLKKLSDYETLPFSVAEHVGKIHYASASIEKNSAQLLELAMQGHVFYGTENERKGYIDALTADANKRAILYKSNTVNV